MGFALLLVCFFLSGFAALLYQTVWARELGFVFGTSELAVAAVLAAYMGGLALGAALAARLAPRLRRPVLAYGLLELGIAGCALAVPAGIRGLTALYVALFGGGEALPAAGAPGATLFQLAGAFAVLVPPTALMGATLPLLARHAVRQESEIGSRVGALYAINTAGAIAGTLCAAFVLMPELGLRRTVHVGAALNALVFAAAAVLARRAPAPASGAPAGVVSGGGPRWLLPAVALSGAASFTAEVLWTRLLGQLFGSSIYAFAAMLASFLLGIALGSAAAARSARSSARAGVGFAAAQLGTALAACAAFALADRLPQLSRALGGGPDAPLASAAVSVAALLPMTLCIGAGFPFAVRLLARRAEEAAAASARVYAWSTLGAIAGSLAAGFVLLPRLGFAGTLAVTAAVNLALAALAALALRPARPRLALVAAVFAAALLFAPPRTPWTLLRSSPLSHGPQRGEIVYAGVGRSANVLLLDEGPRWRLLANGLPESRIDRPDTQRGDAVARWLALLPVLVRPQARDALVVGLGGGVVLEALPAALSRVDVVEIEPEIVAANRAISALRARDPLADPRVRIVFADARAALLLSGARYDAVVSQPSHPWTAGSSHLYTREFFSLVRSRLRTGGVFVQWIGIQFVDDELLRTLLATLLEVFPYVEVFQPTPHALLFAASERELDVLAGARDALRAEPGDFSRHGLHTVEDVAAALVLETSGARAFAGDAPANTDDRNLVAMRAARLGERALDPATLRGLLEAFDPWAQRSAGLERTALVRRLLAGRFALRAAALAEASAGAEREAALGWVALHDGQRRAAERRFGRALELSPGDRDAEAGLLLSQRGALVRGEPAAGLSGEPAAGLSEPELSDSASALLAAWRLAADGGASGVPMDLDAELARLVPGDALFDEAARLRAEWRIAASTPAAGAEALAIADTLVSRRATAQTLLLRARAAAVAARPDVAWAALAYLADQLAQDGGDRVLARRALALADALPPEPRDGNTRARLARQAEQT